MPTWVKEEMVASVAPEDWRLIRASAIHRGGDDHTFVRWPGLNRNVPNPDEAAHAALDNLEMDLEVDTLGVVRKSLSRLAKYRRMLASGEIGQDDRLVNDAELGDLVADWRGAGKGRDMSLARLSGWCENFQREVAPNAIWRERPEVPASSGDAKYWDLSLTYCDLHVVTFVLDGFQERAMLACRWQGRAGAIMNRGEIMRALHAPRSGERVLAFDLETESPIDITDKRKSTVAHARVARVTHTAWVVLVDNDKQFETRVDQGVSADFVEEFGRADRLVAHNIEYDLTVLRDSPGTREVFAPLVNGRVVYSQECVPTCTVGLARLLNFPGKLELLAERLNVGMKKPFDWKRAQEEANDMFETPERAAAREAALIEYARNDVDVMVKAYVKMQAMLGLDYEYDVLAESTRIGMRGVGVDMVGLAERHQRMEAEFNQLCDDFQARLGFRPTQNTMFLKWIQDSGHPEVSSVAEYPIRDLRARTTNPEIKEAIDIRDKSKVDLAKLVSMQEHTVVDNPGDRYGRLRNQYNFAGANTGRWTSEGVQIHNLKREGEARQLMRPSSPDKVLFVSDFAQIELRIVLWLTGHQEELDYLADGNDLYMQLAQRVFGEDATKEHRQQAKVALIASMYGAGAGTVKRVLDLPTEQEAIDLRAGVHRNYPGFANTQVELGRLLVAAIHGRSGTFKRKVRFYKSGKSVAIVLPTGRRIWYHSASTPPETEERRVLFRYRQGAISKDVLYGWTVLNNVCQGFAREFLARAMVNMGRSGVAVPIAHVHDEVISEVDRADATDATFNELHARMTDFEDDCPSDLRLAAESMWLESFAKT